ncbi:MAG: DEAD/DEAH box helicase [Patescibacteria group bacterium]
MPINGFHGLGIAPRLLEALERLAFTEPTPIQKRSIPVAIEGKDLIGIAQTGTGKTLAFGIPMLQRLAQISGKGLVLLPTRELAIQVDESLAELGRSFGLRTAVLIGGASMNVQRQHLRNNPHVVIATPGRLLDHIEQRTVRLDGVRVLVLDEADRMLDMGFAPQIKKILAALPAHDRQTLLFSATMPKEIVAIAERHMKLPISVEIAQSGTTVDQVTQEVFFVSKEDKGRLLEVILQQTIGPVLVFTRTKFGAKRLTRRVLAMGHTAAEIHSNRSLAQRRDALDGFKSGKYRVLIATDIAARGIDVTGIEVVINFDLPMQAEDYVHRIGRTARAGRTGRAVSFAMFDERNDVRSIERLIRTTLSVKPLPTLPPARFEPHNETDQGRRSRPRAPRQFTGGFRPRLGRASHRYR